MRQIARSLKLFVQGLCGSEVAIVSLPELRETSADAGARSSRPRVSADGRSIAFPALLRRYPTREENERLYTVMAAHEAGHMEFGTYALNLDGIMDLVDEVRQRVAPTSQDPSRQSQDPSPLPSPLRGEGKGEGRPAGDAHTVHTLEDLFHLYPQPLLIRDLWTVLEDARVEHLLRHHYPGLSHDLALLAGETATTRSLAHGMSVREMIVDTLLLLTTAGERQIQIPQGIAGIIQQLWPIAQAALEPTARAEDTVRVADRIYTAMEEALGGTTVSGEMRDTGEGEQHAGPPASDETSGQYRPVTNWAYRGELDPGMIRQGERSEREQQAEGVDEDDGTGPSVPAAALAQRPADGAAGLGGDEPGRSGMEQQIRDPSSPIAPHSLAEELLDVSDERRVRQHDAGSLERTFVYDEWDGGLQDYRSRWCRVLERLAPEGTMEFADRVLAEHGASLRILRRHFESLRPQGLRRMPRQPEGERTASGRFEDLARTRPQSRHGFRRPAIGPPSRRVRPRETSTRSSSQQNAP